jgi:hypothetical protein
MPPGFTFWGHIFNGSLAALGLFLTFKLYDYGKEKKTLLLQILALGIFLTVGAIIPYMNDATHIESHGMGNTIPAYVIANDLYVFSWGLLTFRIAKSIKKKAIILGGNVHRVFINTFYHVRSNVSEILLELISFL